MGSGCFEGGVGQRMCISFGVFFGFYKCSGLGSDGWRFGLEVDPAEPSVGERRLVGRTGLGIDPNGVTGQGRGHRDGSSPVPDASRSLLVPEDATPDIRREAIQAP